MDSQDQRAAVRKLTKILRKVTRIIQWIPFVYLGVYAIASFSEARLTDELLCLRDSIGAVTPAVNVGFLVFSRLLQLCRWHRIACILPLSTPAVDYVDNYVIQFTQNEVVALNISLGIISLLFLILANRHFFGNGRKRTHQANA